MPPLSHGWRWHKSANWTKLTQFWTLPQAARGALYIIEELAADGPLVGDRSRVCRMIGIDPRHQKTAIDPLIEAGFVTFADLGRGIGEYRIAPDYAIQDDGKTTARVPQDNGTSTAPIPHEYRKNTARLPQDYRTGERESRIHAGFSDDALYRELEDKRVIQDDTRYNPPNPPRGNDAIDAQPVKRAKKPKAEASASFAAFWGQYPKRVGYGNAVKAWTKAIDESGLTEDALLRQVLDGLARWAASEQWADGYVQHPTTWLNGSMWRDEPPPPKPKQPTQQQPEQRVYKPYDWREMDRINEEKERQENERRRKAKQEYDELMARLKAEREQEEAKSAAGWDDDEIPDF